MMMTEDGDEWRIFVSNTCFLLLITGLLEESISTSSSLLKQIFYNGDAGILVVALIELFAMLFQIPTAFQCLSMVPTSLASTMELTPTL